MGFTPQNNIFSARVFDILSHFPATSSAQKFHISMHVYTYTCTDMWWIPLRLFPPVTAALVNKQRFSPQDKYVFQQLFHLPCLESSPVVRDYSQTSWTLVSSLSVSSSCQASHLTQLIYNVLQGSWLCKCWRFWWWDCCPSVPCCIVLLAGISLFFGFGFAFPKSVPQVKEHTLIFSFPHGAGFIPSSPHSQLILPSPTCFSLLFSSIVCLTSWMPILS